MTVLKCMVGETLDGEGEEGRRRDLLLLNFNTKIFPVVSLRFKYGEGYKLCNLMGCIHIRK